jgi:hypothetical protein
MCLLTFVCFDKCRKQGDLFASIDFHCSSETFFEVKNAGNLAKKVSELVIGRTKELKLTYNA